MKTKIITKIQKEMKSILNENQYLKLTKTLISSFKDIEVVLNEPTSNINAKSENMKLLNLFLSANK